jgi:hypothetical protein
MAHESRRLQIVELARFRYQDEGHHNEYDINIDANADLKEDDDDNENGCYVSAWVWVPFHGTPWDKTTQSDKETGNDA